MKIKTDFVTNSSSASFIMYFVTNDRTVDEFTKRVSKFLNYYSYEDNPKFNESMVKMITEGVFTINNYVGMYNFVDDIPSHMKTILLEKSINPERILQFGFKDIVFSIEEDS